MTFRLSPNSPKNGALGDRALQPHCSCPPLEGVQGVVARLLCGAIWDRALQHRPTSLLSPAGGGQGVVTLSLSKGYPAKTVENRSLQPPLHACNVGTVPRCRDCRVTFRLSPNSPKSGALGDSAGCPIGLITLIAQKAARSGTAPYSLVPCRSCPPLAGVQGVVVRLPYGTHCSLLFTRCSLLVARRYSPLIAHRSLLTKRRCP